MVDTHLYLLPQHIIEKTEDGIPKRCQVLASVDGKQTKQKAESEPCHTEFRIACLIVLRSDSNPNICQR